MIVSFTVANYRSFDSEETLSLVASNRLSDEHEGHTLAIPDAAERVLRVAVLYGANGAGKSNLFKALRYFFSLATKPRSREAGTEREAFRFGAGDEEPTSFVLQFIAGERLWELGARLSNEHVVEEWLYQVVNGRPSVIYERVTSSEGDVTVEAPGLAGENPKLDALVTVGAPLNQTFLATVLATLDPPNLGGTLQVIKHWFNGLALIGPDAPFRGLADALDRNRDFLDFASSYLKNASTGIDHLEVVKTEISDEELKQRVPWPVLDLLAKDASAGRKTPRAFPIGDDTSVLIEKTAEGGYREIRVQPTHAHPTRGAIPLKLEDESDGTRRLLHLLPALHLAHSHDAIFVIDEIDRSLHPILVREFLSFFLRSCCGGRRQVIVTTHDSSLLDQNLLRRDEIWFAEKDHSAATRLYSLTDLKVRKDLEIQKNYLRGRFGAVPFVGGLERLLTDSQNRK